MSSPNDPSREPTLEQKIRMTNSFGSFLHNTSLAMLVITPVLIALPPRKLDLYTFFLAGGFFASANHLTKERTGAGLLYQLPGARPPPMALEYQRTVQEKRLLDEPQSQIQTSSIKEQLQKRGIEHRKEEGLEKMAKELWMGEEKEGWKEKRLAEEQKKLDEGEGYGSMIVDQIWEVWNWGEKKAEDLKEKDEEVVKARQDAKKS
ncbi:hypothetical protein H2198_004912 [Neophaeococcomyces mojaviensis]|uniref:Uncharacterized protein n=1 Tax=Neophaeococcomyces mojaviensis TaxID=3383035 RepID=A0ACC3A7D8_9EURO|nr:hypothetical protein H2198_004912 [Knufia sp. JES_112]